MIENSNTGNWCLLTEADKWEAVALWDPDPERRAYAAKFVDDLRNKELPPCLRSD